MSLKASSIGEIQWGVEDVDADIRLSIKYFTVGTAIVNSLSRQL